MRPDRCRPCITPRIPPRITPRITPRIPALWFALLAAGLASTDVHATGGARDGEYWTPLPDERLADMRGGFDLGNGLKVSFGIERAVYVNGALVTTTSLNVGALAVATSGIAPSQNAVAHSIDSIGANIIQNGKANLVHDIAGANNPIAATVIQNTMDNQAIRSVTVVNATVNSLQILKSLNFGGALRDAIGAGIGPR